MSLGSGARKCLLRKWPDSNGYGFNLHAEKGKVGQYVGQVDEGCPAVAAGLKQGDRIVEVNGVNVAGESHSEVVNRIRASGEQVWFLVVDKTADEYCRNNNITINSEMAGLVVMECPVSRVEIVTVPAEIQDETVPSSDVQQEFVSKDDTESTSSSEAAVLSDYEAVIQSQTFVEGEQLNQVNGVSVVHSGAIESHASDSSSDSADEELPPPPADPEELEQVPSQSPEVHVQPLPVVPEPIEEPPKPQPSPQVCPVPELIVEKKEEPVPEKKAEPIPEKKAEPIPEKKEEPKKQETNGSATKTGGIVDSMTKMTAAEMREMLKAKKKQDPRNESHLSTRDKLVMFQKL